MSCKQWFLLIACFFSWAYMKAQPEVDLVNKIVEELFEEMGEEADEDGTLVQEIMEELHFRINHPLPLNSASRSQLQALYFLTEAEIEQILMYRRRFGDFIATYELQAVEGLREESIRRLLVFTTIKDIYGREKLRWKDFSSSGRHESFLRHRRILERQLAYVPANRRYPGSPDHVLLRYNYRYGTRISYGFTAEKDPGEQFFRGAQSSGFDFYSAHLFVNDFGSLRKAAIGDYALEFGQGLVLWQGFSVGKNAAVMQVARNARGILPYRSVNENLFMRGAAATVEVLPGVELTAFGSGKRVGASFQEVDPADGVSSFFTSFAETGLHRTETEINNRKSVRESIAGGHVSFRKPGMGAGLTAVRFSYDADFLKTPRPYNYFDFRGNEFTNIGINYNLLLGNMYFFGEGAYSSNNAFAGVSGVMASIHPKLDVVSVYRNYDKSYHSRFSNAFSDGSRPANEKGLYLGASANLARGWQLNMFFDKFSFPWLRYLIDAPGQGHEYLLDLNYRRSRRLEMYWRYREKQRPANFTGENHLALLTETKRQSFRYHLAIQVSNNLALRNRVEFSRYLNNAVVEPQSGILFYQDFIWRPGRKPYNITFRYSLFDIDGFNARIYTFENDVLYAFSSPFFQDEGIRCYLLLKYRLSRNLEFWVRGARTAVVNRDFLGSGPDRIPHPHRTEIKTQLRFRL